MAKKEESLASKLKKAERQLKSGEAEIPKLKEAVKNAELAIKAAIKASDKASMHVNKCQDAEDIAYNKLNDSECANEDVKLDIKELQKQIKEAGKKT